MGMTSEEIRLIIKSDSKQAQKELDKLRKKIADLEKNQKKQIKTTKALGKEWAMYSAIIGTAVVAAFKKSIDAASALEEATSKFNEVFADSAEVMGIATDALDELTGSYAMSEREARQSLATMQDLLEPMGIIPSKAAGMSSMIVKLASDLSSFNDVPIADAMTKIQSGLVGMGRPLLEWGVQINQATLKNEALRLGLISQGQALDGASKAQAALSLMLKETSAAQGDMIRTGGSFANQMKKTGAIAEDMAAAFGSALLPAMGDLLKGFTENRQKAIEFAAGIGSLAVRLGELVKAGMKATRVLIGISTFGLSEVAIAGTKKAAGAIGEYTANVGKAERALKTNKSMTDAFNQSLLGSVESGKKVNKFAKSNRDAFDKLIQKQQESGEEAKKAGKKKVKSAKDAAEEQVKAAKKAEDANIKASENAARAHKRYVDGIKQGLITVTSFTASSIGEVNSLYQQHAQNQITRLEQQRDAQLEHLELQMEQELEAAGLAEETETQQAEAEIQQLQINLAKATTAEEQDRIKKQIQIKKDIIAKLAIQDKYEKEKQRIADISAAKELAIKVKAAEMQKKLSIAQTLLETPLAAMRAYSSAQVLGPVAGPIVGGIMAAAASALGAAKLALIRSTPLPAAAEGGIIPGSAGGTALIAGEGGRSEAIIPFENEEAMEQLGGAGGITVNINIENAIMDTDEFPQTIALHIDKALYDLKRNNLSLALG